MTCNTIISFSNSFFNAFEFPKTPSPKPARIPPQPPPAGGKSAEAGRIHSPRHIVSPCRVLFISFNHLDFARNSFELCPANSAKIRNSNFRQKYGRRKFEFRILAGVVRCVQNCRLEGSKTRTWVFRFFIHIYYRLVCSVSK